MASRTSLGAAALGVLALCCAQLAHGNQASFTTNFGVPRQQKVSALSRQLYQC